MKRFLTAFVLVVCATGTASATPEFARRTMLSCNACHAVGTALTEFGAAFKAGHYRVPRLLPPGDVPVAARGQGVYSSEPDPTGLPKAIVDEIDLLSSAPLGPHISYGAEVYELDGGVIGSGREGWLEYSSAQQQPIALHVRAGLQVLPIPVDPERFRETNAHYAVYDQTAGANPFTFFDPHNALRVGIGREIDALHLDLLVVDPHDPQSVLPRSGTDQMIALSETRANDAFEVYRYDGRRIIAGSRDDFWREGYSASWYSGRVAVTGVLQNGFDANAAGDGIAVASSGGFLQVRTQLGRHAFAIARYDGTSDTTGTFSRATVFGAGTLLGRAFRLEIEDQVFHAPQTHHALSIVFGFGVSTLHEGSFAY